MKKCLFLGLFLAIIVFSVGCESRLTQQSDAEEKNIGENSTEASGTIDDIEWSIKEGVLTISGTGSFDEIPWKKTQTSSIQKVIIEDGVTDLPYLAFAGYENLNEAVIGDGITYLGPDTFLGCKNLKTVEFGEGLNLIDGGTFEGCRFEEFHVPDGCYFINGGAFSGCKDLEIITIPETVTQIGDDAFADCEKIVVYTVTGSAAEEYAIEHDIPYVLD